MDKIKGWVFRHLFREDYEHMRHLVDDVIRLETRQDSFITQNWSDTDCITQNFGVKSEIREGVEKILWQGVKGEHSVCSDIFQFLHANGVVIKADELPIITKKGWYYIVKSLIKEE